jgi:glycosyltransferase involved in cell wall biosynthesis
MRIVFLSQLLPLPLDAGPKIRAYYVLRHLVDAGHEVSLACFVRPADREHDILAVRRLCHAVVPVPLSRSRMKDVGHGLRSLVSTTPFLIRRDHVPAMDARLARLIDGRSFDAVHADQLWMAPYAARCSGPALKVLDQHNAVFKVPERLAAHQRNPVVRAVLRREASMLARFERTILERFDRVVWVSEDDRQSFPGGRARTDGSHQVIPIAVDPETQKTAARARPFRVTFLGGMHWPPNAEGVRWFVERVWPSVADAVPDCEFTVIGKGSAGRLGRRDQRSRIEVTGYVADLQRYVDETAVFVVPLRTGAGMRVKILDAWCWGLPVVSTSIGAEGVRATPEEDILIADAADEFADAVIRVLKDRAFADTLSANGRATVESLYHWRKVYRAWDQVYR